MTIIVDTNAMDTIITQAMRGDDTWEAYVEQVGVTAARAHLIRLRTDVKAQRTLNAARLTSGEITRVEHAQWLAAVVQFERSINRRLASILADPMNPDANHTPEQYEQSKRRIREEARTVIDTLAMAIHQYLEDAELGENVLEEALDTEIHLGRFGSMRIRDAIERGLVPRATSAGVQFGEPTPAPSVA